MPVTLEATFPFSVLDGSRQISAAATSHELSQPAGKSLTLSAPDFLLRQTLRVDGGMSLTEWTIKPEEMRRGVNNNYAHMSDSER